MSYTCIKYTVQNISPIIPVTITWRGCNGLTRTQTLRKKSSISICALNNSVKSSIIRLTNITRNCKPTNECVNYLVTNNSSFYQTFEYVDCQTPMPGLGFVNNKTRGVEPGQTISVCMCVPCLSASENFNFTLEKKQPCVNGLPVTPTPSPYNCFSVISYEPPNQDTLVLFTDCCGNTRQFVADVNSSGYGTPPEFCIRKNSAISSLKSVLYQDPCVQTCGTPTPTPSVTSTPATTPTNTLTPTPTPTKSLTPTPTKTQTNTPSVTLTPTKTPTNTPSDTPTPTPTPTPIILNNPILVGEDEYLNVGDNQFLQY